MAAVDVTLTARGAQVSEPWLWRLGKEFDVEVNLVRASVDTDYGWVHVQLRGAVEEIQRAIAWLMTTGLHVDSQQRSVRPA